MPAGPPLSDTGVIVMVIGIVCAALYVLYVLAWGLINIIASDVLAIMSWAGLSIASLS